MQIYHDKSIFPLVKTNWGQEDPYNGWFSNIDRDGLRDWVRTCFTAPAKVYNNLSYVMTGWRASWDGKVAYLDDIFPKQITTLYSNRENILKCLTQADLVIGAVLLPGRAAPKLVRREDLKLMKPGAVIVDVAVDQGGCVETTHATTHADPIFLVDGIVHYCVANMPGAVARTATQALVNATAPYGLELAGQGVEAACKADKGLISGLNCYGGKCTCKGVAEALNLEYTPAAAAL